MNALAVGLQILYTLWFSVTHLISLPPLNNLKEEAFPNERRTNFILIALQILFILGFVLKNPWLMWMGAIYWTIGFVGHILSWWLPYFFGWPKVFLNNAVEDNAKTYHFLPARKNHPIPDLNHFVIGILLLSTMIATWLALT